MGRDINKDLLTSCFSAGVLAGGLSHWNLVSFA